MLFLGLLPQGDDKHNREPHSSEFLNGILHYLFLPLTAGYLTVLYIYATRILVSWDCPLDAHIDIAIVVVDDNRHYTPLQ